MLRTSSTIKRFVKIVSGVVTLSFLLAAVATAEHGNSFFNTHKRIPWTTSRIHGTPEPPPPFRIERVFPKLSFNEPVYLIAEPGSDRLIVVERKGKIFRFDDNPNVDKAELYLDLGDETYSLAFHPKYAENGIIFVFRNLLKDGSNWKNHISKFRTTLDERHAVEPKSEEVLIEWTARGHNGGDMAFGPDGMLYLTSGDGETGVDDPDPTETGQDLSDLRGGILRIDVDRRDGDRPYTIPPDNPFIHWKGARPELWAFGLRNPWRFSFDRETGRMWIGSNGEETWESIYLGKRGANYGWSVLEGSHPFNLARKPAPVPFELPIAEHSHAEARSIMGGIVYHGTRLKELQGVYVYGDHETGKVWGLRYDSNRVTWHKELADTNRKIISFAEDHDRELLVVTFGGEIFRLAPNAETTVPGFPRRLSETGLFASVAEHCPAAGLIPYSINAPAWSDGASIERFIAIPDTAQIKYQNERGWEFPDGTVLVQSFSLPGEKGDKWVETRLLHRLRNEWHGYSYRWNDEQTDATLVAKEGEMREYEVGRTASPSADGVDKSTIRPTSQTWHFPSRAQCIVCHSLWGPRYVIGISTPQMNRNYDYGVLTENQIGLFARLEIFENPPTQQPSELSRLADPADAQNDLNRRARSYLHANCAHCHRYGGTGNARMRLGFDAKDDEMRIFDVPPEHGSFGLTDARLIAPGSPQRSVILYRMAKLGRGRMPHLGSQIIDTDGLALIWDWIAGNSTTGDKPLDETLTTTSGALSVLHAIDQNKLDEPTKKALIAKAASHPNRNVRDLFERFLPPAQRSQILGDSIQPQQILTLHGDAEQGQRLFFETAALQCRSCHQIAGKGVATGPDLTRLTKRSSRAELLESLLDPSKFVDPKYESYVVATSDGRTFVGLLMKRSTAEVVIKDAQNNEIRIAADDIEDIQRQRKSLMPGGLLRDLTAQEAADLLDFLFSVNHRAERTPHDQSPAFD